MAKLSRERYDAAVRELSKIPANGRPDYDELSIATGLSNYHLKGIWEGKVPRPLQDRIEIDKSKIEQCRKIDEQTIAACGQRLRRQQAKKCVECNRKFTLLFENGTCLSCQGVIERKQKDGYF